MISFGPDDYPPALAELLRGDRNCPLDAGRADQSRYEQLAETLVVPRAFSSTPVSDREMAALCCGAVWLLHNYLDESHKIFQAVATPSGSYWHGIMHRREGDYSNAKYWFRRVGRHPVFEALTQEAAGATPAEQANWDPFRFVDRCQHAARRPGADEQRCRTIQQREWELLFDHCFREATRS